MSKSGKEGTMESEMMICPAAETCGMDLPDYSIERELKSKCKHRISHPFNCEPYHNCEAGKRRSEFCPACVPVEEKKP